MPRSLWTGSLAFGLVNVPVKAYPAVRDHDVHFHRVDAETGSRVRNRRVDESTDREVDADDVRLGFEVAKGRYVTFSRAELDELRPASSRTVEIGDFVALDEIDPVFYERTYWLAPDGAPGARAYALLLAAVEDRRLVAIGTVVMRTKQYLAAVRPMAGALVLSTLRFADEVVARADVEGLAGRRAKPDVRALSMAVSLIDAMHVRWDPARYRDTYTEQLRRRIKAKQAGKLVAEPEATPPAANVIDLLAALEQSVAATKGRRRTSGAPRRAAGKRSKAAAAPAAKAAAGASRGRAASSHAPRRSA